MPRIRSSSDKSRITNTNATRQSRKLDPVQRPATQSNGWTRKSLLPYSKYKKLYGERKFAKKYPEQPFRFLDLPGEIRNQIYRYILCFGSIELSPKASLGHENRHAARHHMHLYRRNIVPSLRLLRLNKQVNLETASIFYRENEFRFSSMHGHDMLVAFCRTIGRRNTAFLQKIVEHGPWFGYCGERPERDRPAHFNITSWGHFKSLIGDMGLHEKGYGAWNFNIRRMLTRIDSGLTEYTLVVPDTFCFDERYDFDDYDKSRTLLPWIEKNSRAQITLAKLDSKHAEMSDYLYSAEYYQNKIRREALQRGWRVLDTEYDHFGYYDLQATQNIERPEQADNEDAVSEE